MAKAEMGPKEKALRAAREKNARDAEALLKQVAEEAKKKKKAT